MPTTMIDARVTIQEDNKVWLKLITSGERSLEMTALLTMTLEEIATLIINQEMPGDVDRTLQRRYTIDWHAEGDVRVVDNVTQEQLPDESARDGYDALPGWATWTAQEAADWIETNVVDLASAKVALKQMARAITFLRDF